MVDFLMSLAESGRLPESVLRLGARRLLRERLNQISAGSADERRERRWRFIEEISRAPLALEVKKANEQHYEVPSEFFTKVLGPRLKYSSAYYRNSQQTLAQAEEEMLELVCERAELFDGMNFLELGCGWGSLSLYVAERFPRAQVTGVSNSHSQRDFIMRRAGERNLKNIQILTQDMNNFETNLSFDRVASIEMFEHMRNWDALLKKVASWMRPEAKLFIHVFCHREYPYLFETEGAKNWMGRYFFTAGMMPFDEIFLYFQKHLRLEKNWVVDGTHYSKTSRDWLKNLESNKRAVLDLFEKTYGSGQAQLWYQRWRLFFIACEECFGFQNGQQWWVAHARLCKV